MSRRKFFGEFSCVAAGFHFILPVSRPRRREKSQKPCVAVDREERQTLGRPWTVLGQTGRSGRTGAGRGGQTGGRTARLYCQKFTFNLIE